MEKQEYSHLQTKYISTIAPIESKETCLNAAWIQYEFQFMYGYMYAFYTQ